MNDKKTGTNLADCTDGRLNNQRFLPGADYQNELFFKISSKLKKGTAAMWLVPLMVKEDLPEIKTQEEFRAFLNTITDEEPFLVQPFISIEKGKS